jgi:prevent-host-death family protein
MAQQTITLTKFKQNLGEVINQAAYGQTRIVLLARGKPRAAIISMADLKKLQLLEQTAASSQQVQEQLALLAEMDELREQSDVIVDSTTVLQETREERLNDLMDLP